jgi:hypothetical protein
LKPEFRTPMIVQAAPEHVVLTYCTVPTPVISTACVAIRPEAMSVAVIVAVPSAPTSLNRSDSLPCPSVVPVPANVPPSGSDN